MRDHPRQQSPNRLYRLLLVGLLACVALNLRQLKTVGYGFGFDSVAPSTSKRIQRPATKEDIVVDIDNQQFRTQQPTSGTTSAETTGTTVEGTVETTGTTVEGTADEAEQKKVDGGGDDDDDDDDSNGGGDSNADADADTDTEDDAESTADAADDGEPKAVPIDSEKKPDLSIRKWGCDLTETPLIFVHNGKSGGGNIRARLAAAAQNYHRRRWQNGNNDKHFYPIPDVPATVSSESNSESNSNSTAAATAAAATDESPATFRRGRFCNSKYPHYTDVPGVEAPLTKRNYEGSQKCNATTPLGIAVACPHHYKKHEKPRRDGKIMPARYLNDNCHMCDDDYYLEIDYYFAEGADSNNKNNSGSQLDSNRRRKKDKKDEKGHAHRRLKRKLKSKNSTTTLNPLPAEVIDPTKDPPPGTTCDIVFTAHNNIGSELNWLPPRYLKQHWWDQSVYSSSRSSSSKSLDRYWDRLLDDRHRRRKKLEARSKQKDPVKIDVDTDDNGDTSSRWCPGGYKTGSVTKYDRPSTKDEYDEAYEGCSWPLAMEADRAFVDTFFASDPKNYSPFYASMPLHRVTMLRDPWAWIVSKFFWHNLQNKIPKAKEGELSCRDVHARVVAREGSVVPFDPITGRILGWCEQFALIFLIKLCGNDCRIRYENGMMAVEEIEAQAASNLRNAFSVVGLLHETESFYDMVTDRIAYVSMDANPSVTGANHATRKSDENTACKKLFATDEAFRESVRRSVPAFAALERVYRVGVEVNAFQKEELRQCKIAKGESPTRGKYPQR